MPPNGCRDCDARPLARKWAVPTNGARQPFWARAGKTWLARGPVGIVGFGQVGRRLAAALRGLGLQVLVCDPPLAEAVARGALEHATSEFDRWAREQEPKGPCTRSASAPRRGFGDPSVLAAR